MLLNACFMIVICMLSCFLGHSFLAISVSIKKRLVEPLLGSGWLARVCFWQKLALLTFVSLKKNNCQCKGLCFRACSTVSSNCRDLASCFSLWCNVAVGNLWAGCNSIVLLHALKWLLQERHPQGPLPASYWCVRFHLLTHYPSLLHSESCGSGICY